MGQQATSRSRASVYVLVLVALVFATGLLALQIGYRDLTIGTDYPRYYRNYEQVYRTGSVTGLYEPGYEALMLVGACLRMAPELFFAFAFFQMWLVLLAMRVMATSAFGEGVRADSVALVGSTTLLVWPFYWNCHSANSYGARMGSRVPTCEGVHCSNVYHPQARGVTLDTANCSSRTVFPGVYVLREEGDG